MRRLHLVLAVLCLAGLTTPLVWLAPPARAQVRAQPAPLVECDRRTPIGYLPFDVVEPGSYYLTGTLFGDSGQDGITIHASDVTLDLNGFALVGGAGTGTGIFAPLPQTNVEVFGGTIRGWGDHGLRAETSSDARFHDLRLDANGGVGLWIGSASEAFGCAAHGNGLEGFSCDDGNVLGDCVARGNGGAGFLGDRHNTIDGCSAIQNAGRGFEVDWGCVLRGCTATANADVGLFANAYCTVTGCTASEGLTTGLWVGPHCTLTDSTSCNNQSHGVVAFRSTITSCTASANGGRGISAAFHNTVESSSFCDNGAEGFQGDDYCNLIGCTAVDNGSHGIEVGPGSLVQACSVSANGGDGVLAGSGSSVVGCTGGANLGACIEVAANSYVARNHVNQDELVVTGSGNRVEENSVLTGILAGMIVQVGGNVLSRNACRSLGFLSPYSLAAGNDTGPIGSAATSTSPFANIDF